MKKKVVLSLRPDIPNQLGNILNILSGEGLDIHTFYDQGVIIGFIWENRIPNLISYHFFKTIQIEEKPGKLIDVDISQHSSAN